LYFLGLVDDSCEIGHLRLFNSFLIMISYMTFFIIISTKKPNLSSLNQAFAALTLSMFPLHYFFGFLYYTDVLSTILVLSMMSLYKFGRHKLSASSGALAVVTRQTNIVWIFLQVILTVWEVFERDTLPKMYVSNKPVGSKAAKKKDKARDKKLQTLEKRELADSKTLMKIWVQCCVKVFPSVGNYGVVITGFGIFVILNGGIAVGDKEAHQASINLPQILYFGLFSGFFLFPTILPFWKRTLKAIKANCLAFIIACLVGTIFFRFNTVVHPYMLADNRHYTFYIWKRVFEWYPSVKYALVPVSLAFWTAFCTLMELHPAMSLSYIFCICGVLIPQKLFEFRYFIVPYFLIRLEIGCFEWKRIIPEFLLYFVINVITLYLFVLRPFMWTHEPDQVQRFMW